MKISNFAIVTVINLFFMFIVTILASLTGHDSAIFNIGAFDILATLIFGFFMYYKYINLK